MEKNVFRGILILIIAVLCCYFLFGIVPSFLFDDDYSVESVEECVYNDITPFEGIALRTETVLTAGSNYSMMIHEVADGERVGVGTAVAMISDTPFTEEDEHRLLYLNRCIRILTETVSSVVTSDASSLENDSREALYDYLDACSSSDMQKLLSSEETLQIAFNKKAVNFDGDAVYSEKLNDYLN